MQSNVNSRGNRLIFGRVACSMQQIELRLPGPTSRLQALCFRAELEGAATEAILDQDGLRDVVLVWLEVSWENSCMCGNKAELSFSLTQSLERHTLCDLLSFFLLSPLTAREASHGLLSVRHGASGCRQQLSDGTGLPSVSGKAKCGQNAWLHFAHKLLTVMFVLKNDSFHSKGCWPLPEMENPYAFIKLCGYLFLLTGCFGLDEHC